MRFNQKSNNINQKRQVGDAGRSDADARFEMPPDLPRQTLAEAAARVANAVKLALDKVRCNGWEDSALLGESIKLTTHFSGMGTGEEVGDIVEANGGPKFQHLSGCDWSKDAQLALKARWRKQCLFDDIMNRLSGDLSHYLGEAQSLEAQREVLAAADADSVCGPSYCSTHSQNCEVPDEGDVDVSGSSCTQYSSMNTDRQGTEGPTAKYAWVPSLSCVQCC